MKEVNLVYRLKLIWRMLVGDSLWGKWVRINLIKMKKFWVMSEKTQVGSWIWKKMLKLREIAKRFHWKAVGNGRHTFFWYDWWSDLGVMIDLLGDRGFIEMGIRKEATLEEVLNNTRRRKKHRRLLLNDIEAELEIVKRKQRAKVEDGDLWRGKAGYKPRFSTTETWMQIRETGVKCSWGGSIWFSQATPKFAFITWIAARGTLATMDRISRWN